MNQTRVAVAVLLVFMTVAGWFSVFGGKVSEMSQISDTLERARLEEERELYAKAIASYEEVLAQKPSKERYEDLDRVYARYYEETNSSNVRSDYAEMLSRANKDYPKELSLWEKHVQLYLEREDYSAAYKVLRRAQNAKVSSDLLEEQFRQVFYVFNLGYHVYSEVLPGCFEGSYTVLTDEDTWGVVTNDGGAVISPLYPAVGQVGADGNVVVTDQENKSWLVDAEGMAQVRYDETVAEAGCWNEGLVPVKFAGEDTWSYLADDGTEVLSGYLAAGSFYDGEAAVRTKDGWMIIDQEGEMVSDEIWEEIRLDARGAFVQNDCILAKSGGQWRIYSDSWKENEDFLCDDIDICADGLIAFCESGKWGFVDEDGEVVIEPAYEAARSFSGGVGAVCKDGLWGFIDEAGELVVDYQFADVGYFDVDSQSCPVWTEKENGWVILNWEITDR